MPRYTPASSAVLYAVRLWTRAAWLDVGDGVPGFVEGDFS